MSQRATKTTRNPLIQALILNLSSLSRNFWRISNLIICLLLISGTPAAIAAPWALAPELKINSAEEARLRLRTPELISPEDFDTVLTSLALRHPYVELRVEKTGDKWIIQGTPGSPIARIEYSHVPLAFLQTLKSMSAPYIGQVHVPEIVEKISHNIKLTLKRKGYFDANTKALVSTSDDGTEYKFEVDIGAPCTIKNFEWTQTPPIAIDQSIKIGEICDLDEIERSISETETLARNQGYNEANLKYDSIQFTASSSYASIKIKGEFGRKVKYKFTDHATNKSLASIFSNSDLQAFDPAILSPESVPFELIRQLKTRGFSNAQMNATQKDESTPNITTYNFVVNLGESSVIGRLQLEGKSSYSNAEIFNLLGIERPTQSEGQQSSIVYNPDAISAGVERIRAHYVNNGFWDAKIVDRQIQSQSQMADQKEQVVVVITIEEGTQRVFDRASIAGNKFISTSAINDLVIFKRGDPIDRSKVVDLQQKIRGLYASKGFFYTSIFCETSSRSVSGNRQETIVVVKIDEGPRVKFGDIFVTGLVKTDPKIVYRELYFKTGDWYDPELVSLSRKALLQIGAFSTAIITPLDPDIAFKKSEMVDLVIHLTESPTRTVTFGPGWSSYYGMRYNVEAALTNIAGTGRQLYGRANFNEEAHQHAIGSKTLIGRSISAGYLEPHLFDSNLDGTVSLSQGARATEYAWSLTKGGEVEIIHRLRTVVPGSKISWFYGKKLNDEIGAKEDVDAFLADTFAVGRTGLRFNLDRRNDPMWTSSGYTINSELSWARYELGGNLRYFRWEFTNNHYYSLLENLVFAFGLNFTSYESVERQGSSDADILPASERLTAGGGDSIRGFEERSIGPNVRRPTFNALDEWDCGYKATPTGGSRRIILKAETRYRFTSALGGTLFLDSGTASFSQQELDKFERVFANSAVQNSNCPGKAVRSIEENQYYEIRDIMKDPELIWARNFTSVGAAVNFLTPIGSINLAYGVPWHEPMSPKCKRDPSYCYTRSDKSLPLWKRGQVHFNVGAKF